MFMIRNSQMDIFQESLDERFVERTAQRIRETDPLDAKGIDAVLLKGMVKNGIARARSHQLSWESSITGFVYLMFSVAPDFDERPAFREILDNVSIEDENRRMGVLFERIPEEEWEEARLRGDRAAWSRNLTEKGRQ
jgi:hypothetical protein